MYGTHTVCVTVLGTDEEGKLAVDLSRERLGVIDTQEWWGNGAWGTLWPSEMVRRTVKYYVDLCGCDTRVWMSVFTMDVLRTVINLDRDVSNGIIAYE